MWWVTMLLACGSSDPWAGAPTVGSGAPVHYDIEVRGRVAGGESRWSGVNDEGDATLIRRRTWSVMLGGEPTTLRAASEAVGDGPIVAYRQWISGSAQDWVGSAWIPDAMPPPGPGRWPVLDPWSLQVHPAEVTLDDTGVMRWETPSGVTRAQFDADGLVWAEHGVIRMVRRSTPSTDWVPFDPVALFAVPVPPQPRARRALIGHFEVDGDPFVVNAPVWAQIRATPMPPRTDSPDPLAADAWAVLGDAQDQREAVRRLVRYVADRLDGQVRPGSLAAVEALEAGRGDCDEAAAAFVALARSVGLAADPVGGLVYANGVVGPGLYPHAWAEVQIGGRMVQVDPALGQAPADASHLRLGTGASEAASRLAAGVQVALIGLR